jgi:hypothetical protein
MTSTTGPDPEGATTGSANPAAPPGRKPVAAWQKLLPWAITIACFAYLYTKISGAAAREGMDVAAYLLQVFSGVSWGEWLLLMIPYSLLFFLIDTAVVWSVVSWFNAKLHYFDILPIRGSSYILSILNEQVGKGAMALYLNRRYDVPGWQVGSSMLFIMFCEFYYLLMWATIGWASQGDALPEQFKLIPTIGVAALVFLAFFLLFFSGKLPFGEGLRGRDILKSFREAKPWQYLAVIAIRSPALLSAVVVYTLALRLFGVEVGFGEMLGYLPVIFFGAATPGPMRSVAISLWVFLFPGHEGQMAAFGFVQHNFFIFFNAAIGLIFLRRANRELFGSEAAAAAQGS